MPTSVTKTVPRPLIDPTESIGQVVDAAAAGATAFVLLFAGVTLISIALAMRASRSGH